MTVALVRSSPGTVFRAADVLFEVIVLVGALVNLVIGLLMLLAPAPFLSLVGQASPDISPETLVYAAYAGARQIAVALALLGLRAMRKSGMLSGVLVVAAVANAIDATGALATGRWAQLPGALVFALAYLFAAMWRSRRTGSEPA